MNWEIPGYAAAVLMGLSLGLMGGGGSILTVPILVYLFGMDAVTATGLSLFIVGATSGVGLLSHHRQGNVQWRAAAAFGLASITSVYATRHWLVPALPDPILRAGAATLGKDTAILGLFAVMMLASAWRMIRGRQPAPAVAPVQHNTASLLLTGMGVGLLTGVLGAGGGFLIVPALVLLARMDMKQAVGTSLFIITANALIGFLGDRQVHLADHIPLLVPFLALAVLGILAGSMLAKHVDSRHLRPAFGWFILAMGTYILMHELYTLNG
ncbi:MAG: sulfite exporter TauE/SafE family protein [Bacteroidetes bacterium]|nr:sulfite exporter TauE/SafE family protein [Bacteroidota bacterium]MBS1944893.1 sulfite exporter TauE/SafE family protein [Bacteroidota bacterium]